MTRSEVGTPMGLRPEPVAPPASPDDLFAPEMFDRVVLTLSDGEDPRRFVVTHLADDLTFKVHVDEPAPRGRKWNLRALQVGALVLWGRTVLRVRGRTGSSLKLQVVGHLDAPEGAGETP